MTIVSYHFMRNFYCLIIRLVAETPIKHHRHNNFYFFKNYDIKHSTSTIHGLKRISKQVIRYFSKQNPIKHRTHCK